MDYTTGFVLGILGALLAAVHPWAATGAAFGCCFFLASPATSVGWRRVSNGLFSWGLGYATGVFWYGEGPPYSPKAMLIAAAISAVGAVMFTAFYFVIDRNGTLPPWLESLLDRVPLFKRNPGASDDN